MVTPTLLCRPWGISGVLTEAFPCARYMETLCAELGSEEGGKAMLLDKDTVPTAPGIEPPEPWVAPASLPHGDTQMPQLAASTCPSSLPPRAHRLPPL